MLILSLVACKKTQVIPTPPQPTETNDGTTILKPNISSWKIKQLPNFSSGYYYIQGPLSEFPSYVYIDSNTSKELINPLTISSVLAWYDPNNVELTGNFIYRWNNDKFYLFLLF